MDRTARFEVFQAVPVANQNNSASRIGTSVTNGQVRGKGRGGRWLRCCSGHQRAVTHRDPQRAAEASTSSARSRLREIEKHRKRKGGEGDEEIVGEPSASH